MYICVHISVTKWCIVGYLSDALWDLWYGSIRSRLVESPNIYRAKPLRKSSLSIHKSTHKNVQWNFRKIEIFPNKRNYLLSVFSCMKVFEFLLKFHLSSLLRVESTISQHWLSEPVVTWFPEALMRHTVSISKSTFLGLVTHICVRELGTNCFRSCFARFYAKKP